MQVGITLRTDIEFSDIEDINDAQELIMGEMTAEEILELAQNQGNAINIDVEEY